MAENKFEVKITNFEGPLDLLLHLIEEQEVDIYEINISEIAEQYLFYIHEAKKINLEIASEFLVMAARLLQIKVRRLLPKKNTEEVEETDRLEEELFSQLFEYKKYKETAKYLKEKREYFSKFLFREIDETALIQEFVNDNPLEGCDLKDLEAAFLKIKKRVVIKDSVIEIFKEEVSIDECIDTIYAKMNESKDGLDFIEIFPKSCSRTRIIITFLALLELIKEKIITFVQNEPLGNIYLFSVEEKRF